MPLTTEQKNCEECLGCTRVSVPTVITKPGCYYVTTNIRTATGPVTVSTVLTSGCAARRAAGFGSARPR